MRIATAIETIEEIPVTQTGHSGEKLNPQTGESYSIPEVQRLDFSIHKPPNPLPPELAQQYQAAYAKLFDAMDETPDPRRQFIAPNKDQRILDFGGGTGKMTRSLSQQNQVLVADIDHASLTHARHFNQSGVQIDATSKPFLPLAENSMNAIYCFDVLEHLEESSFRAIFKEFNRVLEYGGLLTLTIPLYGEGKFEENRLWLINMISRNNTLSQDEVDLLLRYEPEISIPALEELISIATKSGFDVLTSPTGYSFDNQGKLIRGSKVLRGENVAIYFVKACSHSNPDCEERDPYPNYMVGRGEISDYDLRGLLPGCVDRKSLSASAFQRFMVPEAFDS